MCLLFGSLKRSTMHSCMSLLPRSDSCTLPPSILPPTLQPSHSEQIFHLAQRIDQHLEVVEEKIDGMTVPAVMIRPPSPQETELTIQLEAQKRQMEAMMAMMETMRIEKEKQEQEAKKKAEQEEARELAEIHKKLAINWYGNSWCDEQRLAADLATGDCGVTFIKKLEAAGEIMLYAVYTHTDTSNGTLKALKLLITSQKVYSFQVHTETSRTTHYTYGVCLTSGLHYMPVYTFDKPLNLKQTKMLSILKQQPQYKSDRHCGPILDSMNHPIDSAQRLEAQKKFESIIRLIPGSYQNGDWRPMDGFFGLYFNETTMEVNEFPGRAF